MRDISQAYTQSEFELNRPVYIRPLPEMHLPDEKVLLTIKPLYGMPKAGLF